MMISNRKLTEYYDKPRTNFIGYLVRDGISNEHGTIIKHSDVKRVWFNEDGDELDGYEDEAVIRFTVQYPNGSIYEREISHADFYALLNSK
jgi:hypothetical protein